MKKHLRLFAILLFLSIAQYGYGNEPQRDPTSIKKDAFIIHFATDSSNPSFKERSLLKEFIKSLDTSTISSISILGFCDDLGSTRYNDTLSKKRANNIKNIFLEEGVKITAITKIIGKGELPIGESSSKDQLRALNRRVEVMVTNETQKKDSSSISISNLKIGDKLTLSNILFSGDRSTLLPESYAALESLVGTLKRERNYNISILGHISAGSTIQSEDAVDLNTGRLNLSEARAKVIYDYLIENDIAPNRLSYKGLGGKYPTGKGDKFDRRVEIQITGIISPQ